VVATAPSPGVRTPSFPVAARTVLRELPELVPCTKDVSWI
jgi:hypothetical protein